MSGIDLLALPRDDTADAGRLSGTNPFCDNKFSDRNWDVLDVAKAVATKVERALAGGARLGDGAAAGRIDANRRTYARAAR